MAPTQRLRATSYELRATSYELRATSYELRAKNYELRVTTYYLLPTAYYLLPTTYSLLSCYLLMITPTTSNQPQTNQRWRRCAVRGFGGNVAAAPARCKILGGMQAVRSVPPASRGCFPVRPAPCFMRAPMRTSAGRSKGQFARACALIFVHFTSLLCPWARACAESLRGATFYARSFLFILLLCSARGRAQARSPCAVQIFGF